MPGCLHLPLSHSEVANCGNSLQPRRAGPGGWPAWFYRASPSQSGSKELGQLSNFAKAAPFSFPRCYNKYTHWGRGGSAQAVRGTPWLQMPQKRDPLKGSWEALRSSELRRLPRGDTRAVCICLLTFQLSEMQTETVFVYDATLTACPS